jgi:SAM-dependent methyltransferase
MKKTCICGSKFLKVKFKYVKRPKKEKIFEISSAYKRSFFQCMYCSHMLAQHFFTVDQMYAKQYFELVYGSEIGLAKKFHFITNLPLKKSDNKNRANRIEAFFNYKKLNVLDIGSGSGVFLFEMKKKGWDVTGFERDSRYADFCKKNLNIKIHTKGLSSLNSKFDLITLNKVLEHIERPLNLLSNIKKKLNKNGHVYIEVPDILASRKGKNRQEFGLEHYHVFSIQSLDNMINKSGLVTVEIKRLHDPSDKHTLYAIAKKK